MSDTFLLEELRQKHKPQKINVLFVGESIPASGKFFYAENSILFYATYEAFRKVYSNQFTNGSEFLDFFKLLGCYLDDLCLVPVNRLGETERVEQRLLGIDSLSQRIKDTTPKAVIIVMSAIKCYVEEAIDRALVMPSFTILLPFPCGEKNKQRYLNILAFNLRKFHVEGILQPIIL